jgi:hypothetical protein
MSIDELNEIVPQGSTLRFYDSLDTYLEICDVRRSRCGRFYEIEISNENDSLKSLREERDEAVEELASANKALRAIKEQADFASKNPDLPAEDHLESMLTLIDFDLCL